MAIFFTVGHGTRTTQELIEVLVAAGVDVLVDVRRYPVSRRHPHFSRESLEQSLTAGNIAYEWKGDGLGGRRRPAKGSPNVAWRVDAFRGYADHLGSAEFRRSLAELEQRAETGIAQAVMCAETVWWRCHRRLIADALVAAGHEVVHLGMGRDDNHQLHESARLSENGVLIYDLGVTAPLDI